MFERGIKGGIMQSVHRWAAANNPYMGSEYDKSKPTRYLQYLDANSLSMAEKCCHVTESKNLPL